MLIAVTRGPEWSFFFLSFMTFRDEIMSSGYN